MKLRDVLEYLQLNAPEIGRLAQRGDKLAMKVFRAYKEAYDHRTSIRSQNDLIAMTEDYIRRDINVAEAAELKAKFGHKDDHDPIIIPDSKKVKYGVRAALRHRH